MDNFNLSKLEFKSIINGYPENNMLRKKVSITDLSVVVIPMYEGKEIGYAVLDIVSREDDLAKLNAALLFDIYIKPKYRNKGVGKYLINETKRVSKEHGIRGLCIKPELEDFTGLPMAINFRDYLDTNGFKAITNANKIYFRKSL